MKRDQKLYEWLENKVIVFFGDSITADLRFNFVTIVFDRLADVIDMSSVSVINSGVDSSTILDITDRLPDVLIETRPDIAVIFVGINDSKIFRYTERPLITVETFESGYNNFIERLDVKHETYKILLNLPPLLFEDIKSGELLSEYWFWRERIYTEYNRCIENTAKRPRTILADVYSAFHKSGSGLKRLFCEDGVHPNIYGHKLIAETVLEAFAKLGGQERVEMLDDGQ